MLSFVSKTDANLKSKLNTKQIYFHKNRRTRLNNGFQLLAKNYHHRLHFIVSLHQYQAVLFRTNFSHYHRSCTAFGSYNYSVCLAVDGLI